MPWPRERTTIVESAMVLQSRLGYFALVSDVRASMLRSIRGPSQRVCEVVNY
jgi:hypothetical protein